WLPTYVEEVQERFPYLPTCLYARNWWDEPEAHDPGWQLLPVISGTLNQRSARALLESIADLDPALRVNIVEAFLAVGVEYDLVHLQAFCMHILSPLSDLAIALSMLLRSTGNHWLDCDGHNEMPYEEVWWYRLSRQKSTNFESKLSSKEKSLWMIGAIHRKRRLVVQ
ncbi:MAG TPA: hypothetical protein VGU68_15455, partial [Ktedonobacteraceae bacterium]|nr:hypothetical protein [Ktedonobacteraceae bacterium]